MTRLRHAAAAAMAMCTLSAVRTIAQQSTVFQRVWTEITTQPANAGASANMPNIGQSAHMIAVLFPAASADVTADLRVRIEASYDNATWIAISRDVTRAAYNGVHAMAIERANAVYPFVRVRALEVPAAAAMTVYYTGSLQPIGQVLCDDEGCSTSAPDAELRATWNLCASAECNPSADLTVPWIATRKALLSRCHIAAGTAPAGGPLVININRNGASIFGPSKLQLAAGSSYNTSADFALREVTEGDRLTIDIDAVGTTTAGERVNVTCVLQ